MYDVKMKAEPKIVLSEALAKKMQKAMNSHDMGQGAAQLWDANTFVQRLHERIGDRRSRSPHLYIYKWHGGAQDHTFNRPKSYYIIKTGSQDSQRLYEPFPNLFGSFREKYVF